jgi:hypothetical protein
MTTTPLLLAASSFAAGAGAAWAWMRRTRRCSQEPFARARVVAPPHPDWLPPQPQPMPGDARGEDGDGDEDGNGDEDHRMIEVDPSSTPKAEVYALCISAVVPRPIALVSSIGPGAADGGNGEAGAPPHSPHHDRAVNVAPYSYFNILSHDPPTVGIGMCRSSARGGARKDSFANIEATG